MHSHSAANHLYPPSLGEGRRPQAAGRGRPHAPPLADHVSTKLPLPCSRVPPGRRAGGEVYTRHCISSPSNCRRTLYQTACESRNQVQGAIDDECGVNVRL